MILFSLILCSIIYWQPAVTNNYFDDVTLDPTVTCKFNNHCAILLFLRKLYHHLFQAYLYQFLPLRTGSRVVGFVGERELPRPVLNPILNFYCWWVELIELNRVQYHWNRYCLWGKWGNLYEILDYHDHLDCRYSLSWILYLIPMGYPWSFYQVFQRKSRGSSSGIIRRLSDSWRLLPEGVEANCSTDRYWITLGRFTYI